MRISECQLRMRTLLRRGSFCFNEDIDFVHLIVFALLAPKMWLCRVHSSLVLVLAVSINGGTNVAGKLSCPKGNYGIVSSHGVLVCRKCNLLPKCPSGMGMSTLVQCGDIIQENTKLHCVHCIPGKSFSPNFDNSMCQPCQSTTCKPNEAFDGKCTVFPSKDTTQCNGKCIKGYYTKTNNVDDCKPCAKCYGPKAKRVQKCIADNEPRERQCETYTASPSPTGSLSPTVATDQQHNVVGIAVDKGKEDKAKSNGGYEAFGHPAFFATSLVLISVLVTCLLFIIYKKKCSKRIHRSSQNVEPQLELNPREGETVYETNHDDGATAVPAVLKKGRSNSVSKRKVSFTRQLSASEMSEEREALVGGSASMTAYEEDVFKEEEDGQTSEIRRRSSSSVSTGKKGPSFGRQNSNPGCSNENLSEPTSGVRKSKTFSSFSNILSKGTPEEREPILSFDSNDNDMLHGINMTPIKSVQDSFQVDHMTKKPTELNAEVYKDVCLKLNQAIEGKDLPVLAGRMGYTHEEVKNFTRAENPADALLSCWQTKSGNDVKKLVEYLEAMERSDIIELLMHGKRKPLNETSLSGTTYVL